MKATQLRLGNIVGLTADPHAIDHVLMLQPGLVHLESGTDFEEEGFISEVRVSAGLLARYGIPENNWFYLGGIRMYIALLPGARSAQLHIGKLLFKFRYMHELQNLVFDHTGHELIQHPHIHAPYGGL
jgi:hypothetical protein